MLRCQEDAYLAALDAEVVASTALPDGGSEVVLDQTPLYPGGGGQPADGGTVGGFGVVGLSRREDGAVVHHVAGQLRVGERVRVEVDWPRRYDYMQQHTAQHMTTATALSLFGWRTVAFHLGPERSDVEFDLHALPEKDLAGLEARVNELIRQARPVRVRVVAREDLAALKVRSRRLPEGLTGPIRLIEIEGVDLNTCGGTHVANTAQVQMVKFLGTEKIARGTRLFYVAGGRVLRELDRAMERDRELNLRLTCGRDEHVEAVERLIAERRELSAQLKAIRAEWAVMVGRKLASRGKGAVAWHRADLDQETLRAVALAAREARPDLLVLATAGTGPSGLVVLAAPEGRAALAFGEVARLLEVRGGGRGTLFQGRAARLDKRDEAAALIGAE